MLITNQQALSFLSVKQLTKPSEARAVPITLDYSVAGVNGAYYLNLQNMQARDFIGTIQALWIDNSNNSSVLSINFPVTNQTVQFPPSSQGYINVLCVNPAQINFTTSGTPIVQISLLNYPVTDIVWSASGGILTVSGVLTNAQVLTMFSAPFQILPPPPSATSMWSVIKLVLENVNGGVAYTLGGAAVVVYGVGGTTNATAIIPASFFTVPVVSQILAVDGNTSPTSSPSNTILGLGLYLLNVGANFATGTGTLKYNLTLSLIPGL